jgi:hypothetical protein
MLIWLTLFLLDNDGPGNPIPPAPTAGGYRLRRFPRAT